MYDRQNVVIQMIRLGYLCIQGYPHRICSGCTTACNQAVYVFQWPEEKDGPYSLSVEKKG